MENRRTVYIVKGAARWTSGQDEHPAQGEHLQGEHKVRPYMLYVGTVQPRKNLVRPIEAFAQLNARQRRTAMPIVQSFSPSSDLTAVQLVIAGKRGWLTDSIERRAAELGIADRVRFTGYVDDQDLPALLSGALRLCAAVAL